MRTRATLAVRLVTRVTRVTRVDISENAHCVLNRGVTIHRPIGALRTGSIVYCIDGKVRHR